MQSARFRILILGFLVLLFAIRLDPVGALPDSGVTLTGLVNCPSPSGCAAGQRLNFKADYSFSQLDVSQNPNVQICVFTPVNWSVEQPVSFASQGMTSKQAYIFDTSHCTDAALRDYSLVGGASAKLLDASVGDSLTFAFRLGSSANTNGVILVRLYERNTSSSWLKTAESQSSIPVAAKSASVFVANDAITCGANTPCFVNSTDDLPNGIGTGLKDAIDAAIAPATITLLGNVNIKQNPVLLNQPLKLIGSASSRLTYSGSVCTQPMLTVTAGATLSGLTIDDGSCAASTSRDLVMVNSAAPVLIDSNDLSNGRQAITAAAGNTASLTVRNNHITSNSGYAIFLDPGNTGVLEAVANNIEGNRAGAQVECNGAAKGVVDHNYWGVGVLASAGASNCTVNDAKRLGAEIARNLSAPGVQAQKVTVGTTPQYAFNNSIGFQRSASGGDFGLYIVNHGSGSATNIPFTAGQAGNLLPCSNYWDVFFESNSAPADPAMINLFFKYNLSSACLAAVESTKYCGQTATPANYPLWWYDLTSGNWLTTGAAGGQPTNCHPSTDEIQVTIDGAHGKPGFNELQKVPFVVGVPPQPVSVTFLDLVALPGSTQATLAWTTSSETNMAGYYIQRSTTTVDTSFTNVSSLLPRNGSGSSGASYQYTDTNLTNNTPYYYRVLVVGYDGSTGVSGITSVTPIPPTPTITLTPSITPIPDTATYVPTLYPTSTFFYRTSTRTATRTATPTSPFKTITNTPSFTATVLTRTATVLVTSTYPAGSPVPTTVEASTVLAMTRQARTAEAQLSATPSPTPSSSEDGTEPITLVMTVLAVGALMGGAVYLIREHRLAR